MCRLASHLAALLPLLLGCSGDATDVTPSDADIFNDGANDGANDGFVDGFGPSGAPLCDLVCQDADDCGLLGGSVTDCIVACTSGDLLVFDRFCERDPCSCFSLHPKRLVGGTVVGAWPAAKAPTGSWRRVCDGSPTDHWMLEMNWLGHEPLGGVNVPEIPPPSLIRDGDFVGWSRLDASSLAGTDAMTLVDVALNSATSTPQVVAGERAAHAVAYKSDRSSDQAGLLIALLDLSEPLRPDPSGLLMSDVASQFLFSIFRSSSPTLVATFGEDGLDLFCDGDDPDVSMTMRLRACLDQPLTEFSSPSVGGPSRLWTHLDELLVAIDDAVESDQHVDVVVVSQRPDDCRPDTDPRCAPDAFESVRQHLNESAGPGSASVRVSFLDVRGDSQALRPQLSEIACMSGGNYIAVESTWQLREPVGPAWLNEFVAAGVGHWQVVDSAPAAPPAMHVVTGTFRVPATAGLSEQDVDISLAPTSSFGDVLTTTYRATCGADAACTGCQTCSPAHHTCEGVCDSEPNP